MRNMARSLSLAKRNLSGEAREAESGFKGGFLYPPGHFYSPIPSPDEVRRKEKEIFDTVPRSLPGIDLNEQGQLELLQELRRYYGDFPFGHQKRKDMRFFLDNPSYAHSDAVVLYCMTRHLRPRRIIEVGCGYSSCLMLDTNELYFSRAIALTCIEPYPQLLLSLISREDEKSIELIPRSLQDVDAEKFSELSAGDILFIDSSHVAKINSDVNHIFFRVLPALRSGVYIHFHDIFYPFEYPKQWVYDGLAWNEAYLLRAFLQNNDAFRIEFFNTYLGLFHSEKLLEGIPLPLQYVGASIWIKKV